jgi:toluene monooxygenase system protein B
MSPIPVRAVFEGDLMVWLVALDDADTVSVAADKIAHHAVGVFVTPQDRPMRVWHNGGVLDPGRTLREAAVGPMDILRVSYA